MFENTSHTFLPATIFLGVLVFLTGYNVVVEKLNLNSAPTWANVGLIFLLIFYWVSAAIIFSKISIAIFSFKSAANDTTAKIIAALGAIFGIWFSNILHQICCNALRRYYGMPTKKIELYRRWT